MDRQETKKAIEVIQAYVDGSEIQVRSLDEGDWYGFAKMACFNFVLFEYRIKPLEPREFEIMLMGNGDIRDVRDRTSGHLGEVIKVCEVI